MMKLKTLALLLALALTSIAQTSSAPADTPQQTKVCLCCNHDGNSGANPGCTACCKEGKCPMMSGSHAGMKCPMMSKNGTMADQRMCCSSKQCPMHAKGDKGCCCGNMEQPKQPGI